MPEHRARKHHQDRVAETLREEIGAMIEGELVDPRIGFCYVTEVALNPGGKSAQVYVALDSAVNDIASGTSALGRLTTAPKERGSRSMLPPCVGEIRSQTADKITLSKVRILPSPSSSRDRNSAP